MRDKPHIDLPRKYPSTILTFWKFHSLEDTLHIVFYFFSCTSQPSGTTAVADPKLFVILLPGN